LLDPLIALCEMDGAEAMLAGENQVSLSPPGRCHGKVKRESSPGEGWFLFFRFACNFLHRQSFQFFLGRTIEECRVNAACNQYEASVG
jgi:hypothetical protein